MTQFSTLNNIFKQGSKKAEWLYAPQLQQVLALLAAEGEEARVIGGAVRDTLLGRAVHDIDIAATLPPEQVLARAKAAGLRCVPYAPQFGTVLILAGPRNFEITTLREDIATDGRHATVRFCRDWAKDAARRDFTINAMSADKNGRLYDYAGGLKDIAAGILRFIGDPRERIEEDYLRIMRFFRFYALLPRGRPDAAALRAIAGLKSGMSCLSPERVWSELKKLLAAENPFRAVLWMRTAGVLTQILPESEKWGIDALKGLEAEEGENEDAPRAAGSQAQGASGGIACPRGGAERSSSAVSAKRQESNALLRLMAMIPPRVDSIKTLAARLKLAGAEKRRLLAWAEQMPIGADMNEAELRRRLYCAARQNEGAQSLLDALRIAQAVASVYGKEGDAQAFARLRLRAANEAAPQFPLKGADLSAQGLSGAAIGRALRRAEKDWIESDFTLSKAELLAALPD